MRKPGFMVLAFFIFILVPVIASAKVSVSLRLDRSQATLVDSIRMVVSISGTRNSDSNPVLHGVENFHVTQGGTSSRLEIINGKGRASIDYTYFIQPKRTGTFQIGPAEVRVEGKTFKSNEETLNVVKPTQSSGVDRGPVFLNASLSSTKVYVEEQVIYTLKLYRRAPVSDVSLNLPEMAYITLKQLGKPIEYNSVYHGKSYQVLEVRYALIASRKGNYTIGPSRMNLSLLKPRRRSPRGLFDDPFFKDPFFSFSTGRPINLASEPLELKVLPLPLEGRPADFVGLVGDFKIESKLEPSTIKAGDSATLTVIISGRGNMRRIPDLKGPELENTKLYTDQPVLNIDTDIKGLFGSKTMKWALIPEKEGLYQIPPMTVGFFDTKSHKYRVIKTSPHAFSVLSGETKMVKTIEDRGKELKAEGPFKEPVKELGRDILPVHTSMKEFMATYPKRPKGLFFALLLFMPFFAYSAVLLGTRFRRKSIEASAATKAKKAARAFIKQYNQGKLSSSDLTSSIRDYFNARFGLSIGSLTPDEAAEILTSKGVSIDKAEKLRAILHRLEDIIYTGKGHESYDLEEDIPKLINQIEKEIC